jgi:predicted phosphodiesterase
MKNHEVTRRDFLRASSALAGAAAFGPTEWLAAAGPLRFGLVTDIHYADIPPAGARTYRESPAKLADCVRFMNEQAVDFLVELGDFKDQGKPPDEQVTLGYLRTIEEVFRGFRSQRYHVLGNHDVDSISKRQFLEIANAGEVVPPARAAGGTLAACRSFDTGKGVRFLILDANFRSDGADYDRGNHAWEDANVPAHELAWIERELAAANTPAIAFIHHQLDGQGAYYVKNAAQVREVLERSKKVLAVFQGHRHEGGYSLVNGIHYYTLKALIEGSGADNTAYAIVEMDAKHTLTVTGYRRAESRTLGQSQSQSRSRSESGQSQSPSPSRSESRNPNPDPNRSMTDWDWN